jgi:uncharacterized membrane protein
MSSRWDTGRTEAFSDGVFAIAVTLLVLDLAVPDREMRHLFHGILHAWPAYLGYLTSFATVGGLWLVHHSMFRRLAFIDSQVMRVNLLLLLLVAFLPFPTKLMAQTIRDQGAERTAVIFYGLTLAAVSFAITALWRAVLRDRQLLKPGISQREISAVTRIAAPSIGLHLGATGLAIVAPRVSAFLYLAIAVIGVFRARSGEALQAAAPASAEGGESGLV